MARQLYNLYCQDNESLLPLYVVLKSNFKINVILITVIVILPTPHLELMYLPYCAGRAIHGSQIIRYQLVDNSMMGSLQFPVLSWSVVSYAQIHSLLPTQSPVSKIQQQVILCLPNLLHLPIISTAICLQLRSILVSYKPIPSMYSQLISTRYNILSLAPYSHMPIQYMLLSMTKCTPCIVARSLVDYSSMDSLVSQAYTHAVSYAYLQSLQFLVIFSCIQSVSYAPLI